MSYWPTSKARRVFKAIERKGWVVKGEKGSSHKRMIHPDHPEWKEVIWAFHNDIEIGPKMLARIAKAFHITPPDL